jgi:UDP-2,3-diacylglucosamine pyrophosphatase LpxH
MPKINRSKKPERKKRVYVSDIHMGAGRSFKPDCGCHVYDWLGPNEAKNFSRFLDFLLASADVEEVILLGDTMDNWVCPVDEIPPTFEEIVQADVNMEVVRSLKALAKHKEIKLIYMPGNHDMSITEKFVTETFPGIIFGGSAARKSAYRSSRLLAEHGSAYAMFNAPDPINNPGSRLPLGYFISRVAATQAARTGHADRHFWTYADDMLEMLGPQKMPQSVFEAVLEEADLPGDVEIKMAPVEGQPTSIRANLVKERYANLYEQWQSNYGPGMAFKSVMAEIGYLGDLADYLSKKMDTNIVIFGHSHTSDLDKDSWFLKEKRIYANCGAWCDEGERCTFVETEKDEGIRKHYVRLKSWNGKNAGLMKEEYVER